MLEHPLRARAPIAAAQIIVVIPLRMSKNINDNRSQKQNEVQVVFFFADQITGLFNLGYAQV